MASGNVLSDNDGLGPIRQTNEPTRFKYPGYLGFSEQPWWDISAGTGDAAVRGALPWLRQKGANVIGGGVELLAEGAHAIPTAVGAAVNAGGSLDEKLSNNPVNRWVQSAILGRDPEQADTVDAADPQALKEKWAPGPQAPEAVDPQPLIDLSGKLTDEMSKLDTVLEDPTLSETSRYAVQQAREQIAEQMAQLEVDLLRAQQQLRVQDTIYSFEADQLGLDLDLAPLSEAIEKEGGVGAQTMLAISSIANMEALSLEEKESAVDLVLNRAHFSDAIIEEVDGMLYNQEALKKLNEMNDTQLSNKLGDPASFFSPAYVQVASIDPQERADIVFDEVIRNNPLGEAFESLDETQIGMVDQALSLMIDEEDNAQAQAIIDQLAQATGEERSTFDSMLRQGALRIREDQEKYEQAQTMEYGTPGELEFVYALQGAGTDMGLPPEQMMLLANSTEMHAIIDVMSDGKPGQQHGSVAGVGGLSLNLYPQLMGNVESGDDGQWNPDRGLKWELQALIAYIWREFDGDPLAAADFYRNTGLWGGTSAFEAADRKQGKP